VFNRLLLVDGSVALVSFLKCFQRLWVSKRWENWRRNPLVRGDASQ
jgi:hypothetical protein